MIEMTVALAGNPNVGKSTIFNALTGLRQHTGNWAGKTVESAVGIFQTKTHRIRLVDLPGTYSLTAHSEEERRARDYLAHGSADAVVVVCDATCLQRSLHLALQCLSLTPNVILCVNLLDEAKRRGFSIDLNTLSQRLGIPVVGCTARRKRGLSPLMKALESFSPSSAPMSAEQDPREIVQAAEELCHGIITEGRAEKHGTYKLDRFLTGTIPGLALMLLALALLLWVTILGANAVSDLLSAALNPVGVLLNRLLVNAPGWLRGALVDGMWRVLSWVVSVMLPPMAIFFPLFTILEDAGVLPRVAFALDRPFQRCHACGKQALTCCMGLGCNAAGIVGCRIVDSPRDRLLALLTNSFIPCSGRFPMLAVLASMFFSGKGGSLFSALVLAGMLALAFVLMFLATLFLSTTALKGEPGSFALELPPYRAPQWGSVLLRSVLDRTVFVLARAAAVAAPAGVLIWVLANTTIGGISLISVASGALDPLGHLMGLDGVILLAFVLGLPANEIVLPLILMGYFASSTLPDVGASETLRQTLVLQGWTWETAVCTSLFTLSHWPCSTTTITLWRETRSLKWTALGAALPTAVGILSCMLFHTIVSAFM